MNIKYLVTYIRTQKCYLYFLIVQLLLIVALAVYVFKDYNSKHQDIVAIILEAIMTGIVLFEVIIRVATQKGAYFKSKWNILDFVGIIIIVGLFIAFVVLDSSDVEEGGSRTDVLSILLMIRYLAQLIRVVLTIKENKDMRKAVRGGIDLEEDYQDYGEGYQTKLSLVLNDDDDDNKYKAMK